MKSKKSSGKESIQSSLNSLFLYASIFGIPTSFESRNQSWKNRFLGYFWGFLSFTCLLLNCCFQIFNFFQNVVLCFCDRYYILVFKGIPFKLFEYSSFYLTPSFVAGIPLIFIFQIYFSRKFEFFLISSMKLKNKLLQQKASIENVELGTLS